MTRSSLTNEAVSNVGWQALVTGTNLILKAVILVILARLLAPEAFGLVAATTVITSLAIDFAQLGIHRTLIQKLELDIEHIRTAIAISIISGLGAGAGLYLGAPFFASVLGIAETRPLIEFLALSVAIAGFGEVSASLLQRERKFRTLGAIELSSYFVGFVCVALPMAIMDYGAWALASGQLAHIACRSIACSIVRAPALALVPKWQFSKDLLIPGSGFSAGQVANYLATQADFFIIGRVLGAEALGAYSRAYQLLMLPAQMFGKVSATVLFPTFASIQNQPERIARAYCSALGVIAIITLPMSAGLAILAPELILFLLGDKWTAMIAPFQVLIFSLVFRTSYKISDAAVLATGAVFSRATTQFIYAGAVVAGSLIGIRFGLAGVALGVAFAVLLNYAMGIYLTCRKTGIVWSEPVLVQLRQIPGGLVVAVPTFAASQLARAYDLHDFAVLVIGTGTGLVAALITARYFRGIYFAEGQWLMELAAARLAKLSAKRNVKADDPID